ncbi:hypothetical protein [Neorhodopirellula pilleata]|uniref:hypothetical protein n=1 Tax=Neorhodopirellula pilleata TaxID=2714738 RepID=UPI001E46E324|nr:hypothetical protein [Neorhodopirellula pilleata]
MSDDAGGSRVDCPACDQSFIVPGFAAAKDDDWLGDDFPALAPIKPKKSPYATPADLNDDVLDVDDVEIIDDVGADDTVEGDIAASMDSAPQKSTMYATEYRVRCPHCGTQTVVKAAKAGQEIKCRDCRNWIRVGQPPRVLKKVEMDQDSAPVFQFSDNAAGQDRPPDPYRKSADELLAKASKVEEDEPKPDHDVPKVRDWVEAVFGIFFQIGVMAHWLILSSLASAIAFVALAIDHPILVVGLFASGGMFAAVVLSCGFAIMQSVANEEESVTEWPVMLEPMEWLAPSMFCIAAAALAIFPGWFAGYVTFGNSLTTVCLSMMSIFAIFPFVLLSMLDMQNLFIPFSPDVGRSVTRCEEAWGGFYFSSGLIFVAVFLVFSFASGMAPPSAAVLSIFLGVGATFVYFAMLGRLAYAIGQSVNSKPKENNINEVRDSERKDSVQ